MSALGEGLDLDNARRRVAAAREALRRIEAGESLFDDQRFPAGDVCANYGALQAHVELLSESLEIILGGAE